MLSVGCGEQPKTVINVTFKGNGGTLKDGSTEITMQVTIGEDFVAPAFERYGYAQEGFDKSVASLTADATINAKWVKTSHVNFYATYPDNPNPWVGGTKVEYERTNESKIYKVGRRVDYLPTPKWGDSEYGTALIFKYWFYLDGETEVQVSTEDIWTIEDDEFELYAKWSSSYSPEV